MNKRILLVLPISYFFAACAPGPLGPSGEADCITYNTASACDDQGNSPVVEINLDDKTIDPECVKAPRGSMIIFKIESKKPIARNSVEVVPKEPESNWWPAGTNSKNAKRIQIRTPDKKKNGKDPFPTGEYEYGVQAPELCIDPRVEVVK